MTRLEITNLISKRRKEQTKWANFKNKNLTFLYPLVLALGIIEIIISIVWLNNGNYYGSPFMMVCGIWMILIAIPTWIIYSINRRRAPYMYAKVTQDLKDLTKQLEEYGKKEQNDVSNENLDQLLKYKKLYDSGVITKEEFEQKKKELL